MLLTVTIQKVKIMCKPPYLPISFHRLLFTCVMHPLDWPGIESLPSDRCSLNCDIDSKELITSSSKSERVQFRSWCYRMPHIHWSNFASPLHHRYTTGRCELPISKIHFVPYPGIDVKSLGLSLTDKLTYQETNRARNKLQEIWHPSNAIQT